MDESSVKLDKVIAELVDMGFRFSRIIEAVNAVGPSVDAAIDYIFNDSRDNEMVVSRSSDSLTEKGNGKRVSSSLNPSRPMKQLKLFEPIKTADTESVDVSSDCIEEEDIEQDWELRVENLMQKHFGISSLKSFQKEALAAWIAHQDCLVLAATGSGKSLCFQIPALLTGKVVVVISPLISLMHDQCMKLAKHGVSSCYLGSGQKDPTVEGKAMRGVYDIIYICPETLVRLIKPLQELATERGIALFAIDEVHCISKWGHDFRPDYSQLSVLRENFRTKRLKGLKFDIPLMALTATATIQVREEILKSLHMSEETRIVLTSFFRPNLRFSVKNSRTRDPYSYEKDFRELINIYTRKNTSDVTQDSISPELVYASDNSCSTSNDSSSELFGVLDGIEDDPLCGSSNRVSFQTAKSVLMERNMSVEYLEDECDLLKDVDDLDVPCAEFFGQLPAKANNDFDFITYSPERPKDRPELLEEPQGLGPTIIYVPTRNETLVISEFLCSFGVRAAAYNAKLRRSHLRQVHKEFHENSLEVVVATIAFGMGIDKSNVRRIIHYGWPQSLEAYHQEAGRAGRDGKLADCVLYADFSRVPTLLPSRRSEEHTKRASRMLSDCFRYGMNTSCCRAKTLVQYFGEEFNNEKCHMCDVCINGPPEVQDLKDEAKTFMQAIVENHAQRRFVDNYCVARYSETSILKLLVSRIRNKVQKYAATGSLWWRGLARILEDKGLIREGANMTYVQINSPVPTRLGMEFLQSKPDQPFHVYPEADMLLSMMKNRSYSTSAEWGKGWADPESHLEERRSRRYSWTNPWMNPFRNPGSNPGRSKSRRVKPEIRTVRGRLAQKLSKKR